MSQTNLLEKFFHYINLETDVDNYEKIHETIVKDVEFKGTNLWILSFAIIVASIGLNMNSTAVIIGAMLISPLMGPINGMGYSIATYNFSLLRRAVKNFTFAVIASLIASTAYFALTPISTAYSELLARTSPTIYDVLIALFGGLAGIVAISSKQKGNVIPGVAIATALMPPLCTAGYGLANGNMNYFFGAFYLFTINTVFIAFSSIIISQILKFPIRKSIEESQKKKVNKWITLIITIMIIPSIYFGYRLVEKEKFTENANRFISSVNILEGNYLLRDEINPDKKTINLVYAGLPLNKNQKNAIKNKLGDFSLNGVELSFQTGIKSDYLSGKNTELEKMKTEIAGLTLTLQRKNKQLDSLKTSGNIGKQLLQEIQTIYPQIISASYSETKIFNSSPDSEIPMKIVVLGLKSEKLANSEKEKILSWLKIKLKSEEIKLYYETVK